MPKIEQLYAFISYDKDIDDEGIIGTVMGDRWMPLVGADMARVESLRPIAKDIATKTHHNVKLIVFRNREEVEVIG